MSDGVVASLPPPSNVVFDVDGCLITGGQAIPGAAEALAVLERAGVHWIIASNNSTRTAADLGSHLTDLLGVEVAESRVLTSSQALVNLLRPGDAPVLVIGEAGLHSTLTAAGVAITDDPAAAGAAVIGLDRSVTYDRIAAAALVAAQGGRLLATNDDPTFPDPAGDRPGAGAIVAAVSRAAGRTAEVAGKPHPAMRDLVTATLTPGQTWVVGDRFETDVALARAGGWWAVLVTTGVGGRLPPPGLEPDRTIGSVADLGGLLTQ